MRGIRVLCIAVFALCFLAAPSFAQDHTLTVDLAQDHVDITTGFDGAYLTLFGVKNDDGDVVVVVRGPERDFVVRQKQQVAGAWVNRKSMTFEDVPEFYDFAASGDVEKLLPENRRIEEKIGFAALKFEPSKHNVEADEKALFQEALIRNKQQEGLFPVTAKEIVFLSDMFFKTQLYVPSNVPTGHYVIETFLIHKNKIVDKRVTNLKVAQVGFSAGIYQFAHSYSLAYSLVIIVIAALAGWLSNAVRRKR